MCCRVSVSAPVKKEGGKTEITTTRVDDRSVQVGRRAVLPLSFTDQYTSMRKRMSIFREIPRRHQEASCPNGIRVGIIESTVIPYHPERRDGISKENESKN
ncbi:hypothetical protein KOR42_01970 [Thalassoglobus neptunius]|uniref:Uncharacterized protein n=1 Tax=Thalassoglobus neptunius TaxID=1938619 RepID=A0A5C5X3Y0_9PLAN|nr:hypothetical protein KOR42_01970 [Thalassoglobus neptunius]